MHLSDGAAENGCVLAVDVYQTSVNDSISGDHPIARNFAFLHVEIRTSRRHGAADFNKAAGIQ